MVGVGDVWAGAVCGVVREYVCGVRVAVCVVWAVSCRCGGTWYVVGAVNNVRGGVVCSGWCVVSLFPIQSGRAVSVIGC